MPVQVRPSAISTTTVVEIANPEPIKLDSYRNCAPVKHAIWFELFGVGNGKFLFKIKSYQVVREKLGRTKLPRDKKLIAKIANFWKGKLGLDFYLDGQKCTLNARSSGSGPRGGYLVRASGKERNTLYSKAQFPPLTVSAAEN